MTYRAIFYVSRSTLSFPQEAGEIDRLVDGSRLRNAVDGITGALVFTETNFAQLLEGPAVAIGALMQRIRADVRHVQLDIIDDSFVPGRRFGSWAMAYSGPALFLYEQMHPLLSRRPGEDVSKATADMVALMQIFATA